MTGNEIADNRRQYITCLGVRRRQHQLAGVAAGKFGACPLQVFRLAQDARRDLQHHLARFGNAGKALAAALENGDAELVLKQADLFGHARLGGVQHLGRLRDIESLAFDFDDVAQLLEFHEWLNNKIR